MPDSFRRANTVNVYGLVFLAIALLPVRLSAQTVATYDFEGGSADGWTSFFGASAPVASSGASFTGSESLLTAASASGTGGPSIALDSVLLPGAQYTITAWVRLTSGESASNANFTMKRSDPSCSGGACYDLIGNYTVAVTDSGWAQIGGTYTPATTETGLLLYAQLVNATSAQSFYLDDVVITEIAPPPGGTPVATYTFSDGGLDGWSPFGSPTLTNSVSPLADPAGNANSLLTTNRTASYMGPSLNVRRHQQYPRGRYVPGKRIYLAGRSRQREPNCNHLHEAGGLCNGRRLQQHWNFGSALQHNMDEGARHVQFQQPTGAAEHVGAIHPVEQRH